MSTAAYAPSLSSLKPITTFNPGTAARWTAPDQGQSTVPEARHLSALGVDYWHRQLPDGTDLYLTRHGKTRARWLQPALWLNPEWFPRHRERLRGTSTIYRVQTPAVEGRELQLIVRYSRVGETIPRDTNSNELLADGSFNSPFEEIALVEELRAARFGPGHRILTKRPLAVVVPPTRLPSWQINRSEGELAIKNARCQAALIDRHRQYLLVYGWIKGCDAAQAADQLGLAGARRMSLLEDVLSAATTDLADAGFKMLDIKPEHVIVRVTNDGRLLRRPDGRLVYALVDYELLVKR